MACPPCDQYTHACTHAHARTRTRAYTQKRTHTCTTEAITLSALQSVWLTNNSQNSARARVLFEVEDAAAAADVSTQSIRAVVFNTEVRAPMWHFDSQVGVTRFKPAFTREERQARRAQGIRPEDDAAMENMAEVIEALANTDMPVGEALPMIPQVRVKPMPDIGSCVLLVNDRIPR